MKIKDKIKTNDFFCSYKYILRPRNLANKYRSIHTTI